MYTPITDTVLRAAKEKQLAEARDAYHSLMTGVQARVVVDQNGERVEFTAANKQMLSAYIMGLEHDLGYNCTGSALSAFRPATFTF